MIMLPLTVSNDDDDGMHGNANEALYRNFTVMNVLGSVWDC
jgi:hypothetical protein